MGWELWGFLKVEGLDTRIYGEIRGKKVRSPRRGVPPPKPRVPKGEAPGAPGPHLSRDEAAAKMGHPSSVVVITFHGTWGTRPE